MTRALVGLSLLASVACVSGAQVRASAEVIKSDIERARRSGAMRCAPRELATAEANLDFAYGELAEGTAARGADHIKDAEAAVKKAIALSRECGPKQVMIKDTPVVVKIETTDKDGDGVLDKDDKCPNLPGPPDNQGCPIEAPKDKDGDGILDNVDKCPDTPEDKDGWQDEDGCPEPDNDNDGVLDGADKCPNEPGPIENIGCPIRDRDGDGITDNVDKCPNEAEDKDGFEDEDGCPDLDNDKDGLPDVQDECPNEAGPAELKGCPDRDKDGLPDKVDACPDQPGPPEEKGCPKKYNLVVVTKDKIEIKKQIKFLSGKATIDPKDTISAQVLSEVSQALRDNVQIKKVRIEGHTDSVGDDAFNLKLSQNRANTVMSALIKLGVDPGRMEAVGYGETRPIASNATSAGKAENRRTEFNIVEQ
ncbi:MAG: OmpA family protein [Archangiaceae bacterium]|nr:OmpA family protein [Archangiaceae bacterium]